MNLKLLSEARSKCLYAALLGTIIIVLLVFLQTVNGRWEGAVSTAWSWVVFIVLPELLALWISALLNRYPAKLIYPSTYQILVWGSWLYMLLALLTLLSEPFATRRNLNLVQYFEQSYWWLLPMELLLLLGYALVFFKKESIFKPDERIILDFAARKAIEWKGQGNLMRQQCFEMITANDMSGIFLKMKAQFSATNKDDLNAILLLENQFTDLERKRQLNLIDGKEAQINLNRIVMALINLIERV